MTARLSFREKWKDLLHIYMNIRVWILMSANRVYKSETGFTRKIYLAITSIVDCTQYTTYAMHSSLAHLRVLPVEENHV